MALVLSKAKTSLPLSLLFASVSGAVVALYASAGKRVPPHRRERPKTSHRTIRVGGLDIFYREAGPADAPAILLLHGFPTSSQMFRHLIPALADRYHVVAPDYPGFGYSSMPPRDAFAYTFERIAAVIDELTKQLGLETYALYVQDYGAPIGFRLASAHPERVTAIVVQNGNAYDEGLAGEFWNPIKSYWADPASTSRRDALRALLTYEATKSQYMIGSTRSELVAPDGAAEDQFLLDRKGNDEIQLDLFLDYRSNRALYPVWHEYFRSYQPPTLIAWGRNDPFFPASVVAQFERDLKIVESHLLDTGHFALETHVDTIAELMRDFLGRHVTHAGARRIRRRRPRSAAAGDYAAR